MFDQSKIIFSGPAGVGKSTAVSVLSDIPTITTEVLSADPPSMSADVTRALMDYGEIKINQGQTLKLYTVPGSSTFRFMWEVLASGAMGLVIMINNASPNPLDDLRLYLRGFNQYIANNNAVLGITRLAQGSLTIDDYFAYLEKHGIKMPIIEMEDSDKRQLCIAIGTLLGQQYYQNPPLVS